MTKDEVKKYNIDYHRSKNGLIAKMKSQQKAKCIKRNIPIPEYTTSELRNWCISQDIFHSLFDNWKLSGYNKMKVPSIDRIDDYKGYVFENMQIMTWQENTDKGHSDKINGINNKNNISVSKFTKNGDFIMSYHSARSAERETGVPGTNIGNCCKGYRKSAGGFIWKYSSDVEKERVVVS